MMEDIVCFIYENFYNRDIELTLQEGILDQDIIENIDPETLKKYLVLQDLLLSDMCDIQKEAFVNGFNYALKLMNEIKRI